MATLFVTMDRWLILGIVALVGCRSRLPIDAERAQGKAAGSSIRRELHRSPECPVILPRELTDGTSRLPSGEYSASVIGHDVHLEGPVSANLLTHPRAAKMRVDACGAELREVPREARWLLVVRTPPADEWVVSLTSPVP